MGRDQKLIDRAEMADRYEAWLTNIGQVIGCNHLDDRLQNCVIQELYKADRRWYETRLWGWSWCGIARVRCFIDENNWYTIWLLMITKKFAIGGHIGGRGSKKEASP